LSHTFYPRRRLFGRKTPLLGLLTSRRLLAVVLLIALIWDFRLG
jgi:hypothetical protein